MKKYRQNNFPVNLFTQLSDSRMNILFIDCSNSGLSGDMFLASLLGLIPNPEGLITQLLHLKNHILGVASLDIKLNTITRFGLKVNQLEIRIKETKNHRSARVLVDSLNNYLNANEYSDKAKLYANDVLNSLIKAESAVHDKPVEYIHLHELSSVDTLIDILGVSKALDVIGVFNEPFQILYNFIPVGGGSIKGAHGILPIPAPATMKIIEDSDLIVKFGPIESELLTPTGAALIANLAPKTIKTKITVNKVSYGTGQKKFKEFLNVLRISLGSIIDSEKGNYLKIYEEPVIVLETNIDDVSGELIGHFIRKMEQEDVLDIQVLSGISKKNRTSHLLRILCHPTMKYTLIEKIVEELGTLGVRYYEIPRVCVDRRIIQEQMVIDGIQYFLDYKISFIKSVDAIKLINIKPEFDHLKVISDKTGIPIKSINQLAQEQAIKIFQEYSRKLKINFGENKKEKID